jgi:hypothetical protein
MKQTEGSIIHGGRTIAFQVVYVARKTLEIAVHPDKRVVVKAPVGTEIQIIKQRLQKRARWVERHLNYFSRFDPRTPARQYVGGESHLYLGRRYRLKIEKGDHEQVKLIGGFFHVTIKAKPSPDRIQNLLYAWYMEKAKARFQEMLRRRLMEFLNINSSTLKLSIRHMRTRWGSLSPKGTLTLNIELIRAPKECIDYVITHELCHLKFPAHDKAFYRCLEQHMPDWEKRKHKLEMALV